MPRHRHAARVAAVARPDDANVVCEHLQGARDLADAPALFVRNPARGETNHVRQRADAVRPAEIVCAAAAFVALTAPGMIQKLSRAVQQSEEKLQRAVEAMNPPWEGFFDDAKRVIEGMAASHRVNRKVNGPLHEATNYGKIREDEKGKPYVHIRKPIVNMSNKDIENIVDPVVKRRVLERLDELGQSDPKKAFKEENNLPFMQAKNGRRIPIRSARIKNSDKVTRIAGGASAHNVMLGSNHHVEVFEVADKKGGKKWEGRIVSTIEAMDRIRKGKNIVDRNYGENGKFLFSLAKRESFALTIEGKRRFFNIRSFWLIPSGPRFDYVEITDARKSGEAGKGLDKFPSLLEPLRKKGFKKVNVSPDGKLSDAND